MPYHIFSDPCHTYKTYASAKKIIDKLEDGNYKWLIATTSEGRFFPVILVDGFDGEFNHHYFLENKCCVHVV